jgi:hypothetical protein
MAQPARTKQDGASVPDSEVLGPPRFGTAINKKKALLLLIGNLLSLKSDDLQ